MKIVLLTFANDNENPLSTLDREGQSLYRELNPLAKKLHFKLEREQLGTIKNIAYHLTEAKQQVCIFHYGGHADSNQLILRNQAANSDGIAESLALQESLKLVFLNGCSTKGQVERLLELGIPAVIATSVPIEDSSATDFAERFYHALAQQHSIEDSFKMAVAFMKTRTETFNGEVRGAGFVKKHEDNILPWGLYLHDDHPDVANWKLPSESSQTVVIDNSSSRYNTREIPVNKILTDELFKVLAQYSKELRRIKEDLADGDDIDSRRILLGIINTLPAPIGEQVRKLFAADQITEDMKLDIISVDRLHQLITTYKILMQLIAFTLLAQLWDVLVEAKTERPISKESKKLLIDFLNIEKKNSNQFDYLKNVINPIWYFFQEFDITFFMEELKEDFRDEEFNKSYQFLETMKEKLYEEGNIASDQIESFCLQTEEHLASIFKRFGFCANYNLRTIKNIDIIKTRHKEATFRHHNIKLDTVTVGYRDSQQTFDKFTDDKSVILLKPDGNVDTYLSLSPFIIDENALKGEAKSKLYFFTSYDKAEEEYNFEFVTNSEDELLISNKTHHEIKEQFKQFEKALLYDNTSTR